IRRQNFTPRSVGCTSRHERANFAKKKFAVTFGGLSARPSWGNVLVRLRLGLAMLARAGFVMRCQARATVKADGWSHPSSVVMGMVCRMTVGARRSFVAVALHFRNNPAPKFKNRIGCMHDVAVMRHNNESVAPAPACAT